MVSVPRPAALAFAWAVDRVRGGRWVERIERLSEDRSVDNTAAVRLTGVRPRAFGDGIAEEADAMRAAALLS